MPTPVSSFRLSTQTLDQLDFLCTVTGNSRASLISSMIALEYDRYQGNPELQKIISEMKQMEAQLKSLLGTTELSE